MSNVVTPLKLNSSDWSQFQTGDVVGPANGGTGIANGVNNTLNYIGNFPLHLTLSAETSLTLPTSGTVTAQGNVVTGTGTTIVMSQLPVLSAVSGATDLKLSSAGIGSGEGIQFVDPSNNYYNWYAGGQLNLTNGFEITPSTALGGSTFSTPAISIFNTGNVSIGGTTSYTKLGVLMNDSTVYTSAAPDVTHSNQVFLNSAGGANVFSGIQFNNSGNSLNRVGYIGMISEDAVTRTSDLVFGADNAVTRPEILRLKGSDGSIHFAEASNLVVGTSTGTKIGTATTQKLGFYNATPVVQPSGDALTALSNLGLISSPTLTNSDVGLGNVTNNAQVTSVTGTSNRITSSGGTTPTIDISGSYVGQSSITTVGSLTGDGGTNTWLIPSGTVGRVNTTNTGHRGFDWIINSHATNYDILYLRGESSSGGGSYLPFVSFAPYNPITGVNGVGILLPGSSGYQEPSYTLDVGGDINTSTKFRVGGNIVIPQGLAGVGTYTAGSTTPDVTGISYMVISNSVATSITNFTGAVQGQVIYLIFNDANTTITRDNAYLSGGVNFTSANHKTLTLVFVSVGRWEEITRSTNG